MTTPSATWWSILCGMLLAAPALAAEVGLAFFPDGRSVSTAYSVPLAPSDPKECAALSMRIDKVRAELSRAHSECLKSNPGGGLSTYIGPDRCSSPACQSLHSAGSDIAARGEVTACYRAVDERQKAATKTATKTASMDFSNEVKALARGPTSALKSWVRDKVSSALSDALGTYGIGEQAARTGAGQQKGVARVSEADAKRLVGVAGGTAKVFSTAMALQSACRAEGSAVAEVCRAEVTKTVETFSDTAVGQARTDPAVRLIQSAMLEQLRAVDRQTMASLSDALEQGREFKVIDRSEFPNQDTATMGGSPVPASDSEALIRSRQEEERRLVGEAQQRHRENTARAEERARERQQAESTRQMLEAMTGGSGGSSRSRSRTEEAKPGAACWSAETVCSSSDSKCIAEQRAERARLPRCKGG